jgi:MoxR-like ATPase
LLVDEINRTPPRTQSALLESMQEYQATIDGTTYPLSDFFTVFATQNPIEFEGTYPLPEAQLDRFLVKIRVVYPGAEEETEILRHHQTGFDAREIERLALEPLPEGWLAGARAEVAAVRVEPALLTYVTNVIRRSRDWLAVSLGASPRAGVNLLLAAKATAALDGRDFLIPDDVKAVAPAVLRHRLLLKPEADLEGITSDQVIADILAAVEVPK